MATYKAISNGNADTLAIWETWDGEAWVAATALPSASDDVYTNGYIVTITTSQSYLSFNRSSVAAPLSITQGGQFQIDGANEITLAGQVNGSNAGQAGNNPLSACVNRLATHTNTLHRVGDDVGGSSNFCYAFWNGSAYNIDIIGNQIGGSVSAAHGFYNYAASTFESIIGNQSGGSGPYAVGFYNNATSTFESIIGNQSGGSGGAAYGFYNDAAATFTSIVGNQTSGSGSGSNASHGFYNDAAGSIITFENSFQKTGVYQAVYNAGDSTTINFINCRAYANSIYNSKSTTTINFQGITYNDLQNGTMAIRSLGNVNFDLSVFYIGLTPTYTDIALYPASTLENPPAETDVRTGIVYGIGDAYTGKMVVPIEEHVIQGVEYDINKIGQLPVAQTINSQDVTDIMSNIANIETKIDNVDNKIDTIDTSINTVNNNISNMNIDINTIENELDTAITNINTIDGKVDVIDGKIDTLPTDTLNELKQDDLGERLSKVGTIEEMTNIIINS